MVSVYSKVGEISIDHAKTLAVQNAGVNRRCLHPNGGSPGGAAFGEIGSQTQRTPTQISR